MNGADDPGWRPALRPIWTFLVPWIAFFVFKRRLDLVGIRRVFLHVGITLVELAIVISSAFLGPPRDTTWAWVLLGAGTAGCVSGLIWSTRSPWRGRPGPADLSSAESVANSFRALSFVGAGVSIVLIAVYGPTRARVDEIQERLRVAGSLISLRVALDDTAS